MKQFFIISERLVRGIILCVVVFFLILGTTYIFSEVGFDQLIRYLDDLFNGGQEEHVLFRVCFSYILIASIYRYARFKKFVWDDLHKIFSDVYLP
tara:strand:+ start:102 stop:386 length:285 start_codon:yes stop_codon:yes gene_type:complete